MFAFDGVILVHFFGRVNGYQEHSPQMQQGPTSPSGHQRTLSVVSCETMALHYLHYSVLPCLESPTRPRQAL